MNIDAENIRSAKRQKNEREGVHSWHPYYAGYSEAFVEDMLNYLGVNSESVVLDPWMGSGTTALVCQKKGIQCLGNEINPVMVFFSKAKSAKLLDYNLLEYAEMIINNVDFNDLFSVNVVNNAFIEEKYNLQLQSIRTAIDICLGSGDYPDYLIAFFYTALFRCIRSIGSFNNGSNPTWLTKNMLNPSIGEINVINLFREAVFTMSEDLKKTFNNLLINSIPIPKIVEGDSKDLSYDSNSVDYIITSPPYLTRIDYAVSTKPELLFLGYEENTGFDSLRRRTMGAPVISDKGLEVDPLWGNICKMFLTKVENHHTKAAKSYYLPIYLQYFRDALKSIKEIIRVLRSGGQACLVVQSSYFKEVEGKLGEMYVEMGENLGLEAFIVKREVIKNHLAHVNSKSSVYVKNKVYYEDAVVYRKV
ncbi:DNA methyltransferase [Paenibacillus sp. FSL K6-1558]|uniref:DNA methyltransferase n=1 Tax=Paenibacillus sp. FSL K6-1558 TaxID=2921473 RepID=UPI0012B6EDFA|nr:DNA methyltransferase [Paenibacillus xylanexedens]